MRIQSPFRPCLRSVLLVAWFAGIQPATAQMRQLGEPPTVPPELLSLTPLPRAALAAPPPTGFTVNIASREEARIFFNTVYAAAQNADPQWNGNVANCVAGTTTAAFRDLVGLRINYFRAMAGLPAAIVMDDSWSAQNQLAALMMSANGSLNHFPPANWICYTASGAEAAGKSNLSLGAYGPEAIDGFIEDYGESNWVAGHRRWLLYPQTRTMGSGDIPSAGAPWGANATWVFDSHYGDVRPATRDNYVAWPPPGFVPYPVVYARWSFALPGADFTGATVTMSSNSVSLGVTLELVKNGYGENTLIWHPSNLTTDEPLVWPHTASDTAYAISIKNVSVGGQLRNYSYGVTVFDPQVPGADTHPPTITGPAQPAVNQPNRYTFTSIPQATGYQWRHNQRAALNVVEGAENGLTGFTAQTTSGYEVVVTDVRASGSAAFHLAHPSPQDQSLTYQRVLLPHSNAQVTFKSRLGWASSGQQAKVQVSLDEGSSWQDVYSQAGVAGKSGEGSFNPRSASLAAYAGRVVWLRFNYHYTSGIYYPQTEQGVGWYLDDIAFSNIEELTSPLLADVPSGTAFTFSPTQAGGYALMVRAKVYDRFFAEWGPVAEVTAANFATPVLSFAGSPVLHGGEVWLDFQVANYRTGLTLQLLRSASVRGAWQVDAQAALSVVQAGTRFRFTTPVGASSLSFFRVQAN